VIGSDGTVYVGSNDNNLYAINPTNGTEKWRFATGYDIYSSPAIGSDGTVYVVVSGDNNLYAINPTNGTEKWRFAMGGGSYSSPAIGSDGTIYVGSRDSNLYAINPTNGTEKWRFAMGGAIFSSPAIGSDGTIYVGSRDSNLYAINPTNGTEKWRFAMGDYTSSSPAIGSDGTVYIGSNDNNLYAINASSPLADSPWPMFGHDLRHTSAVRCDDSTFNVTGLWYITETEKPNTCDDPTGSFNLSVVQSGKNVTVEVDYSGSIMSGTYCGNVISSSGSYPEEGGTTTISVTATVSGNSLSGNAVWSWTDGFQDCSGTSVFTGARY
jgi:glucose dehydrogenase